jgi:hypothetical protein
MAGTWATTAATPPASSTVVASPRLVVSWTADYSCVNWEDAEIAKLGSWLVPHLSCGAAGGRCQMQFSTDRTSSGSGSALVLSSELLLFSVPGRQLPGVLGELVQATAGKWITHPPARAAMRAKAI